MTREDHALRVLEFDRVLETVGQRAVTEVGAAKVRALVPLADREAARRSLEAVRELQTLIAEAGGWQLDPVPDLATALRRLAVDDAVLESEDLLACQVVMSVARTNRALGARVSEGGLAARWIDALWGDPDLEKRIGNTFDADGEVSDRASRELRRIHRALVDHRGRLVGRLDRYARALPDRVRVPDASVTVRNGRYCVPVRREGKGSVGGLVHDASASRQTLFVEPTMAIDAMNEIRELEFAEVREVERILRALSDSVRAHRRELADSYEAVIELDALRARALFAVELNASMPAFNDGDDAEIRIRGGRHPLLACGPDGAVPFDLDLRSGERVLLVSGPNAGGKTVLLKAIGLTSALSQSGVIPPVDRGTRLPFFRRFFAVIGDEQSIDASLSTFGAQVRNLAHILNEAGDRDLVLFDEIGSATDPAEGGALAAATLNRLVGQARLTVATTHLGDLKRLSDESEATVNASLEFDGRRLEPTYRLVRDRPGRSYALVIASRLGVPEDVLADARARLEPDHLSLDSLLARLEEERSEIEGLRAQLELRTAAAMARERDVALRETEVVENQRATMREREAARSEALREARELVDAAITALETEYPVGDEKTRREAGRKARGKVERALRQSSDAMQAADESPSLGSTGGVPRVGDTVRVQASNRSGVLVEIRGDRGAVDVDGLRLTVPLGDLTSHPQGVGVPASGAPRPPRDERSLERRPEFRVQSEVDLRGLRVDEVDMALTPALDAAVVSELPWLRIIHGKGTGALRERVQALLNDDTRVRAFRAGKPNEGGTGVTVVEFD